MQDVENEREAIERTRILQIFRDYADFLDERADALPELDATLNIGGAAHIRGICYAIERGNHLKGNTNDQ
jgi:hypothetical protein